MLKRKLRWFVVWSARPPFLSLYRALYRLLVRVAVHVLRKHPGVLAIYVCRGYAKNEILPGISDIDLAVVTKNDSTETESIRKSFAGLARVTGHVIDYYPNLVKRQADLEHDWMAAPAWRYRYIEGKYNWKLLHGTDIVASLPALTQSQQRSSCYAEMNRWWLVFAQLLLDTGRYHQDNVMRNSTCYKACTELLNAHHALRHGEFRFRRASALEGQETPLAKKLSRIAAGRFLAPDDRIMDETLQFLTGFFIDLWNGFREDPYLHIYEKTGQNVDASGLDLQSENEKYLQAMTEYLEREGVRHRGIHLARSAFWNFEDVLVLIDLEEGMAPSVKEVTGITAVHHKMQREFPHDMYLFLRLGSVAFPVTPIMPRDLHRGILTPATMPDVFLQLGESEVYWTDYTQWYLCDWKLNRQWLNPSAEKSSQLDLIEKSVQDGCVLYPLTLPALERQAHRTAPLV